MKKRPLIDEEESNLFRSQVTGVRPLKQDKIPTTTTPKPPIAILRQKNSAAQFVNTLNEPTSSPATVQSEDFIAFRREGLQVREMQKLRAGEFIIEAELDLHGFTVNQAQHLLEQFLADALTHHCHCIRIIHGKNSRGRGTMAIPILKNCVNNWLRQYPNVLAFCTTKHRDGGTGAVYVLLKQT